MIAKINRAYIRRYTDNGQTVAYVEYTDTKGRNGCVEGDPNCLHLRSLLSRSEREGIPVEFEKS